MNKYTWKPPCSAPWLRDKYERQQMSQKEIAQEMGCSLKVVQTAMRRFGIAPRKQIHRDQRGSRNASWKGDAASYKALHLRVASQRGKPQRCEECGIADPNKRYEWASINQTYQDPMDYRRLCCSCHKKADGIVRNLRGAGY